MGSLNKVPFRFPPGPRSHAAVLQRRGYGARPASLRDHLYGSFQPAPSLQALTLYVLTAIGSQVDRTFPHQRLLNFILPIDECSASEMVASASSFKMYPAFRFLSVICLTFAT
jgi:hypothetical protein